MHSFSVYITHQLKRTVFAVHGAMIYKYLAVALGIGASLAGAFLYGQHVATVAAERDALEIRVNAAQSIDAITVRLRDANTALIIEQKRVATVKHDEVIKYVTKYRDVIREVPSVIDCVNDSGLLELINATTPTIPVATTTTVVTD